MINNDLQSDRALLYFILKLHRVAVVSREDYCR